MCQYFTSAACVSIQPQATCPPATRASTPSVSEMAPSAKAKRTSTHTEAPSEVVTPPEKKVRVRSDEAENKRQLTTYLGYQLSEKCKTGSAKDQAKSMQKTYESLDGEMANKFAQKFMDTRKSKDFTWHKTFNETFTSNREEDHKIKENYLTPIWPQCGLNTTPPPPPS